MKRARLHIREVVVLLCLNLFVFGCAGNGLKSGIVGPDAKTPPPTEANIEKMEVKEFLRARSRVEAMPVVMLDDVLIKLGGEVNLTTKQATLSYSLSNTVDVAKRFSLAQPFTPADKREIDLGARKTKTEAFSGEIRVTDVSVATRQAILRPYLLGAVAETNEKLLMAKYDTDLKVRLPRNARLIKSSVALEKVSATEFNWKVKGAPILPPIHLWYTTAAENISADMDIVKGEVVVVTINVKNESSAAAAGLRLLTRFPVGTFEPVLEESDGKFIIEQDVMYTWNGYIESLGAGGSASFTLKLRNLTGDEFPKIQEVAIHNKAGDLVAIAEIKQ